MLQETRLLLLCATVCSAQIGGPPGAPAPPPSPPATSGHDVPPARLTQCAPGDLLPGPTCTSFLMCVGNGNFATRRVKFECGPGTIFSPDFSTCVHSYGIPCPSDGPATPVPGPNPPPLPSPAPPDAVGNEGSDLCPPYKLDPTSVFDCLEPGYFPSLADCVSFYKCIVTMDCFIKGFLFRCPPTYRFDRKSKRCLKEELLGRCDRVADAGAQTFQIRPVVEIQPDSFDEFFQADQYWDFVPFLPNETQTIVSVPPFAFARGASSGDLYMTPN